MSREMFCKKNPVGETYPGELQHGVASEGLTNRDTCGQCQQHEATPELNNKVSNDTLPNNVLILHVSALYCDNTDHRQMSFCSSAAVFPPLTSASVFPPMTLQNLTTRPRVADLKK
jgi:hypothetical protein